MNRLAERSSSTTSAGAFSGEPRRRATAGPYSIPSCTAWATAYGSAVQGGGTDAVAARGMGLGSREDLHRAGDVEALDTVEEDDENGSLRHVIDCWPVR